MINILGLLFRQLQPLGWGFGEDYDLRSMLKKISAPCLLLQVKFTQSAQIQKFFMKLSKLLKMSDKISDSLRAKKNDKNE